MSTPRAVGGAKKRGHQHHPRNEGTRRRAALDMSTSSAPLSIYSKNNAVTVQNATVTNHNNVIADSASPDNKQPSLDVKKPTPNKANNNCDIEVIDLTNCDDDINNVRKESSTATNEVVSKSAKEDRNKKLKKPKRSKSRKRDEAVADMSLVHRPEAEGSSLSDQENEFKEDNVDPEIEELSKLRCTSEMTEVVAEREKRRNRRCADYPGLAFSSIFSSDTLMKFSIIRNELHNIMNTQLKRVGTRLEELESRAPFGGYF